METHTFTAEKGRLDQQVSQHTVYSRSQVQQWIEAGLVRVAGEVTTRTGFKLKGGEEVSFQIPPEKPMEVVPEDVPLDAVFEDEHLIAVNKPPGMMTHPSQGIVTGTLVNALMGRIQLPDADRDFGEEGYRPGIVHRLDKDTSGVIVVAKTVLAHAKLAEAFKERTTQKTYLCITVGRVNQGKVITLDAPVGRHPVQRQMMTVGGTASREAQTHFQTLAEVRDDAGRWYALVQAKPRTGRTHQIRVHLQHLKAPILGDEVYGKASPVISRQALHAFRLQIPHPETGKLLDLKASLPQDMQEAWKALGGSEADFPTPS
ncbi:RluA family pseudouridine synthase [Deinococcus cellulosilyticus]|uniref:Pseudouridine synthase n=1 Tax=Deinococcus cellulosilyticus (strain DSM 18568 / NBRC 106333 / KACC 11606 / 5516J-15) TaxID=1223518 RepID=A0A511N9F5_DEIC1|nr:RluA family pseudouridine synthase [Deinococcus cellulosilyticus]GEM49430.1 pseudouridine synthase [Deinococcus cellulosilyticus NBRC 106333 = KACC 11606]